ncbi:MAG TPA: ABC transporter permease [Lachnospiraceae bacterium]|nr:ABC transporter permease [Lachnospiraceae bacterium]
MIKVNNKETINTLSRRFLKTNWKRNLIAIIAIILTSVMFTSVLTASSSILKSSVESQIRITMDRSHAIVEELTKEQYELVKKDKAIVKQGLSIFLTLAENDELSEIQTEIRYADKNGAYSYLCTPTVGKLPEKEDEIATSTIVLDALKLKHKLGEKVSLSYTLNGKKITKEFTLSGYWEGDKVAMAQLAWVSKTYCDNIAPVATANQISKGNFEGDYNLSIWYSNTFYLDKKTKELEKRCNLQENNARFSSNPAYDLFVEDGFPFGSVAIMLGIIMLSGYLIIYNIFNISVYNDIRAYGLLKNVGTTGKQLKKIVRLQALWLSCIGIPLGMVIGFLIGRTMTPYLLADPNNTSVQASISYHPMVFVASALFTIFTIYIGSLKACHIVGPLSPVEAVRMTEAKVKGTTKRSRNVSPLSMGLSTVARTWRKGIAVIISLALSLLILNMVYIIVKGFDFNSYTSTFISSDFEVNGITSNLRNANLKLLTPEIVEGFEKNKDIKSTGLIYYTEGKHAIDDVLYKNLNKWIKMIGPENLPDTEMEYANTALKSREVGSQIFGINEAAFNKLEFGDKKCTWEEFSSGKYILAPNVIYDGFYSIDDKVNVEFSATDSKEYQVIALANLPYTLMYPYYSPFLTQIFILPEKEYSEQTGNQIAMIAAINIRKGRTDAVSKWLNEYMQKQDSKFFIKSRHDIQMEFKNYVDKYYLIGGMLTFVLFIIGILNFFNTSAASILARKKELSLLEAVGMTKKQLIRMLTVEGILYLGIAFAMAVTLGTVFADRLISASVGEVFFFSTKLSILPSIIAMPFLLLIVIMIPIYNYRRMCKETVVERIRNEG